MLSCLCVHVGKRKFHAIPLTIIYCTIWRFLTANGFHSIRIYVLLLDEAGVSCCTVPRWRHSDEDQSQDQRWSVFSGCALVTTVLTTDHLFTRLGTARLELCPCQTGSTTINSTSAAGIPSARQPQTSALVGGD